MSRPPLSGRSWAVTHGPVDSAEAAQLLRLHLTEMVGRHLEIEPYSDNPYADHWFERQLG